MSPPLAARASGPSSVIAAFLHEGLEAKKVDLPDDDPNCGDSFGHVVCLGERDGSAPGG
jgi:hypothetical protein